VGYLYCQAPSHDDIAALVALDQCALGGLWSAEGYGREIDSPNSCLLMLMHSSDVSDVSQGSNAHLSTVSIANPQISAGLDRPTLLGLGCYWAILDEAHITVLAIDPRYQRRGLGKWLLVNLLSKACDGVCDQEGAASQGQPALTRATLEVRPSNSRALALYESFGFETLGRRRRYYADGEDALILWQNSLKTAEFHDQLQRQRTAIADRLKRQGWQMANQNLFLNRT
jgi:[ribosomal protein S18]-alanine N-acetyltransferase